MRKVEDKRDKIKEWKVSEGGREQRRKKNAKGKRRRKNMQRGKGKGVR